MKKLFLFFAIVIVVGAVYLSIDFFRFATTVAGSSQDKVTFEIPSGSNMHRVANRLKADSLITDGFKFRIFAKLTGQENRLKKGEYLLNKGMTPQEIIDVISSGKSILYPVTFPEGSNIYDMASILETQGIIKAAEFLNVVKDQAYVQQVLKIQAPSLEGYLFPETYNITRYTAPKELVRAMLDRFFENFAALEKAGALPLSRHELVTLASVVEKETGAPEERPLIASVFYNRLNKNMPLQSDPTILYGIIDATGKPTENITKADITRPTRYNTYTVKRLPHGPISNPGREALLATVTPAQSEFLYFVSKNDGTHTFSKTYEQHLQGVKSFQVNPNARSGKSWRDLKSRSKVTR